MSVVRVEGVSHGYGRGGRRVEVLHGVDVELAAGELLALAGRSGSGKSTLCHLVAGLERPASGQVLVTDRPATSVTDWQVLSLLPQRLALVAELSVAENAFLPTRVRGLPDDPALLEALALDGFADRAAGLTSLGEQQRVAIARTLSVRPAVAVLDEPTGHQDDDNVERVLSTLLDARARGTAVLVATHDERVLAVADRVVRMRGGRVEG